MTTQSRLMLSVAAMCFGLALAPAVFAQTMAPPAKPADTMAKPADTMAKPADKSDAMKKDDMKKDTMAKPAATSGAMMKGDDTKMPK